MNCPDACFSEDINKSEEQNKSCDSLEVSFTSHGIFVPCSGPSRSELSIHMNSVQGGAELISSNVNISLTQENNDIARNRKVFEDIKEMNIYQRKKRLKMELSQESLNDGGDSSMGDVHLKIGSTSLDQPIEFECVPLMLPESRAGNGKVLNVVSTETDTDEIPGVASSAACCKDSPVTLEDTHMNSVQGGAESVSCNVNISLTQENNDVAQNGKVFEDSKDLNIYQRKKRLKMELSQESFNDGDDSSMGNVHPKRGSTSLDQPVKFEFVPLMLPESKAGNGKVLNVVSTETDTDELRRVASSAACCKDFPVPFAIKEQCLSEHATKTVRKSDDADIIPSDQLEEPHDEAKETVSDVDGDALGGDTPMYCGEQSLASHTDLSLNLGLLDGTQGVASQVVRESINVPVDRTFAGYKQKKLLVLDINGLLLDISTYVPYKYDYDDIIMNKAVFRRPHCDDFLNFCFEKFNVGFWTSRTKRNMEPLLDFLLGNTKSRLLFHWDQSHCADTGFKTVEKKNKPLLLKKLKKLWDKCEPGLPWERGVYNESNTLLLDDTPYKALSNPPYTAVFPYTYRFRDVRDNSLGPGGDLRVYLEGLSEAENVQEYVKQNPFGQRPITEKNLSWGYYRKVIQANSTPPRQTDTDNP